MKGESWSKSVPGGGRKFTQGENLKNEWAQSQGKYICHPYDGKKYVKGRKRSIHFLRRGKRLDKGIGELDQPWENGASCWSRENIAKKGQWLGFTKRTFMKSRLMVRGARPGIGRKDRGRGQNEGGGMKYVKFLVGMVSSQMKDRRQN